MEIEDRYPHRKSHHFALEFMVKEPNPCRMCGKSRWQPQEYSLKLDRMQGLVIMTFLCGECRSLCTMNAQDDKTIQSGACEITKLEEI